jgi:16S rRNA (adenine1518-N6/adenine1519-N6)-dimethyltransferase
MTNTTHTPRKRFGQNFLHDYSVIANILASLQIKSGEHWVEIGPGQGALTTPLLDKNISLDVVELDRDLVRLLKDKFKDNKNLTIHSADALKFDFSALVKQAARHRQPAVQHLHAFVISPAGKCQLHCRHAVYAAKRSG